MVPQAAVSVHQEAVMVLGVEEGVAIVQVEEVVMIHEEVGWTKKR